ncbi:flagellar export chaperone FliS [Cellulomonas sp. WB94]|uniref:flagellar export chaperone FliS n=1 Tax=Cellulomonas sp. WB94 TaxID=2173174 RepID=UPI000D588DCF|nr:flagellar export chaperone FliS [Cellulomonas sp. WB94]PVU83379.1 flagellar export chaperone FliS [Cellulomonas sp. WB94]
MYDVRSRYLADTVATVGPSGLLTMLYDRMVLDVERGEQALRAGNRPEATQQLAHAQEIVSELISSLDTNAWDGGPGLLSIYTYLLAELMNTSMTGDPERAAVCRRIIAPLRDAWHEAARLDAPVLPTQRTARALEGAGLGVLGVG